MAIKFVDTEPEDGKPKKAEPMDAEIDAGRKPDDELSLPGLPHAKPTPKKRGLK